MRFGWMGLVGGAWACAASDDGVRFGAPTAGIEDPAPPASPASLRAVLGVALDAPLSAGAQAAYVVSGANPGERVLLAGTTGGIGAGPCPAAIGGACLALNPPLDKLGVGVADAQGVASIVVQVPAGTPAGATLSVQAIARRGAGGAQSVVSPPRSDGVDADEAGLLFPANGPGGDVRLVWDGANLVPRVGHTAIIRYQPAYQDGYYAVLWHSPNDGVWDFGAYAWGTHPYPGGNGSVNANGQALDGQGSSGTEHYWESAGLLAAADYLASPGGSAVAIGIDTWVVQIRKSRLLVSGPDAGMIEHVFVPDLLGDPSFQIRQLTGPLGTGGANPAFYIGASDWRSGLPFGADENDETPNGVVRGIQLYDAYLSDADAAIEAANVTDTPLTAAGQASVWYIDHNPTPTDVADRSGAGHDPRWANALRPDVWP